MPDPNLPAIEAAIAAATAGPWVQRGQNVVALQSAAPPHGRCIATLPSGGGSYVGKRDKEQAIKDGQFIALAREAMPALVAEVKRLREQTK